MKKRSGLLILLGLLLLLSACSPGADKPADKPEETIKPAAKDPEGMVMEGPGKFAGKAYDEAKVRADPRICTPADEDGEGIPDQDLHL